MAALTQTKVAQRVMSAVFTFEIGDTMTNASGSSDAFATAAAHAFDIIDLPIDSVVVGGAVVTETAFGGSTAYNVIVGDSGSTNRYLGTTDKTSAALTALVPTGYVNTGGLPIRLTVTPTVATATSGKATVRVDYIIRGPKADDVIS
jgi:hypothetical protein